jgi:putative spermidine/putrescine transport system ATP-binding protein
MSAHMPGRRPVSDRPALVLRGLEKYFGDVGAVRGVDLEVRQGEFVTLLGPSGSGKTTTLRMIAGFTNQTAGTIEVDGADVSGVPPHKRDVGMVFQNYALFPHMTAGENIAFPLQMRKRPKDEIKKRVDDALRLVHLESYGPRYPRQMSGGQQQRIALARAVVFEPALLLMDEPLGALDKKLREALQLEIMHISRQLGATVIYVTHDQEEALVMSDRIAIFHDGRIEQLGGGEDLYERPVSLFVADFIGESNILHGQFSTTDGGAVAGGGGGGSGAVAGGGGGGSAAVAGGGGWVTSDMGRWRVSAASAARTALALGAPAALVVRPERLRLIGRAGDVPAGVNTVDATVTDVLYLGSTRKYELTLANGQAARVRHQLGRGDADWNPADEVRLAWDVDAGVLVAGKGT